MSLFNWRTRPGARPPQDEAREIIDRSHRDRAEAYAACLRVGSEILEDTDGATIASFRHYLPAALSRRGLMVEQIPGGWRVIADPAASPPPKPVIPVSCRSCGSWFAAGCEHGVGHTVVILW